MGGKPHLFNPTYCLTFLLFPGYTQVTKTDCEIVLWEGTELRYYNSSLKDCMIGQKNTGNLITCQAQGPGGRRIVTAKGRVITNGTHAPVKGTLAPPTIGNAEQNLGLNIIWILSLVLLHVSHTE